MALMWRERRLVKWRQLIGYITTHVVEFSHLSFGSAASVSSDETDCRSRKQKQKDKPIPMHVLTLCDWFGSSASVSDSDNLVFTGS